MLLGRKKVTWLIQILIGSGHVQKEKVLRSGQEKHVQAPKRTKCTLII